MYIHSAFFRKAVFKVGCFTSYRVSYSYEYEYSSSTASARAIMCASSASAERTLDASKQGKNVRISTSRMALHGAQNRGEGARRVHAREVQPGSGRTQQAVCVVVIV